MKVVYVAVLDQMVPLAQKASLEIEVFEVHQDQKESWEMLVYQDLLVVLV